MKLKRSLLSILVSLTLISCDKNETIPENTSNYPMTVGTTWSYDVVSINNVYLSVTSDSIVSSDTTKMEVVTWIDKDTIVNNKKLMVFKTRQNSLADSITSVEYYSLDNEGLKLHAYDYIDYISPYSTRRKFVKSPLVIPNTEKMNSRSQKDSKRIYVFDTPVLVIKYPLTTTSEWSSMLHYQINKRVIATETLNISGHKYNCFKVLWNYPTYDVSDTPKITQWLTDDGVIKSETKFEKLYMTDSYGNNIEKYDIIESMTIKSLIKK